MHIEKKQTAINKAAALLKDSGKFILSIDKNQDGFIDTGMRKIPVFPDTPAEIKSYIANSGLLIIELYETEFAHIFIAEKPKLPFDRILTDKEGYNGLDKRNTKRY